MAVKMGQLGDNADTFMPIFSADALVFFSSNISKIRIGNSVSENCSIQSK